MELSDIIKVNGDALEINGRAYERVVHCLDCPYYDITKDYCEVSKGYRDKSDYCSLAKGIKARHQTEAKGTRPIDAEKLRKELNSGVCSGRDIYEGITDEKISRSDIYCRMLWVINEQPTVRAKLETVRAKQEGEV